MAMKNTVNKNQENVFLLEFSNPATVGSSYCNRTETQDKEVKIDFMNVLEFLGEEMNISLSGIYEHINKQQKETNKTFQGQKVKRDQSINQYGTENLGT